MAVVRARSSPPYGMIFAMSVAVAATAAAIVFGVLWSRSVEESESVRTTLAGIAPGRDEAVMKAAGLIDQRNPGYRQLQGQIDQLKALIGAGATASVDAIKADAELRQALDRHASLRSAIVALTADRNDKEAALNRANLLVKEFTDRATAAEKRAADQAATFEASVAELRGQVQTLNQQLAKANQDLNKSISDGQQLVNDTISEAEDNRRTLVLVNEQLRSEIGKKDVEIKDLRDRLLIGDSGPNPTVGEPDGTIIRVSAAAGELYINLTRKDGIREGMTFTAYDPRTGVRFGTDEAAMGNGSIEVMEVGDTSSLCRITRTTAGRAIQAGDLISNLVFHTNKNRKFRFVVIGEFDLDGDGAHTAHERDRLSRMIAQWGGQIDDKVTAQTDYLVVGRRPAMPTVFEDISGDAAPEVVPGSVIDQRVNEGEAYENVIFDARSLSIPVLNDNRFLSMIGYYGTTIVRY